MKITQAPTPRPDVTIEPKGDLYKVTRRIKPDQRVEGLPQMLEEGTIALYNEQEDKVTIFARSREGADLAADLNVVKKPSKIIEKAKEIFLPPDMEKTVAPEYLKFRAWALGASIAAGAVSFSNIAVSMNAVKQAFSSTEKAALAQTINTFVWRFSYMGGSFLAPKGEEDPRKFYMTSNLISSTNSLATLGVLSMIPKAYVPLTVSTSILGAVGSTLGSAAGVNVFNRMALKNKGVVQTKNSNQDLVASMLGMPVALGMKWVAGRLGVNSALLTAGTMAPVMFFCALKAASSIRMEPIRRTELEKLVDNYIATGVVEAAPTKSPMQMLSSLFTSSDEKFSANINIASDLDQVLDPKQDAQTTFSIYKNDKYLLSYEAGANKINIGVRQDGNLDDIFKAYTQARVMEELGPRLFPQIESLVGDKAATAFAELVHRAADPPARCIKELTRQGWHANHLKLHFPTLASEWTGPDLPARPAVTIAELQALAAAPDPAKLAQVLGVNS